jgi:hypothetical protein
VPVHQRHGGEDPAGALEGGVRLLGAGGRGQREEREEGEVRAWHHGG